MGDPLAPDPKGRENREGGALKLWMGAVKMGGVLWVAVLKRDPHAPGGPVRKGCPALQSGEVHFSTLQDKIKAGKREVFS